MKLMEWIMGLLGRRKIDLAAYPKPGVDYGTLSGWQKIAMDNILEACRLGGAGVDIPQLSQGEFDTVVTHIGLHFGSEEICKNIALKRGSRAAINLEIYRQAAAHKERLDRQVEAALGQLYEGSTEYKLRQVADWIADRARYAAGTNDPLALLGDGAMCGAYAMLFYKMATRLGVEAYICYGQASNGLYKGAHAWNKADGHFYDVTWYDTRPRQPKYLRSKTGWGRQYRLNDKSVQQKRG